MMRRRIVSGVLQVGSGQLLEHLTSLIRNIILARLLSPHDIGIAVTFVITISLLEMISNLSVDKLIVQSQWGNEPVFQQTIHALQGARGGIISICIFVLSGPISHLFGIPDAKWAFRVLALVPLLHGLQHLDVVRHQREMVFLPFVRVRAVACISVTLAAWPLARVLGTYAAVLWILVLRTLIVTIGSHLVAGSRYRWSLDRLYVQKAFSFGWPLMINGLLMFFIFQGDRFFISASSRWFPASGYTMSDLAVYSLAFSIVMAPVLLLSNTISMLLLPLLSRIGEEQRQFIHIYTLAIQALTIVALPIAIMFLIAGGEVMTLIYGAKYAESASFIGWLALMQSMRLIRQAPTLSAMAKGDTRNSMISNAARSVALIGVVAVIAGGGSLASVAAAGFAGELLALGVSTKRLRRMHGVPALITLKPVIAFGMLVGATAAILLFPLTRGIWPVRLAIAGVYALFAVGLMTALCRDLRSEIWRLLASRAPVCPMPETGSTVITDL